MWAESCRWCVCVGTRACVRHLKRKNFKCMWAESARLCVCARACVSRLKGKNFKYRPYVGEIGQMVCVCVCACVHAQAGVDTDCCNLMKWWNGKFSHMRSCVN